MKYKRVYELLKRIGNSPAKAAEIILDARRHKDYALAWIDVAFRMRHS